MPKINFRSFRKTYQLNLFSHATSNYKVGLKAEWDGKVRGIFDIEGLYVFEYLDFEQVLVNQLINQFDAIPNNQLKNVTIPDLEFTGSFSIGAAVSASGLNKQVNGKLDITRINNFSFEKVKAMVIPQRDLRAFRNEVKTLLNKKGKLPRKVGRVFFVDKLFYAEKVSLNVQKTLKAELEIPIQAIDAKAKFGRSVDKTITFKNPVNTPFAVKFKTLKDLMD